MAQGYASQGVIQGTVPVNQGGTGQTTLTSHGVLLGEGSAAINQTSAGTSGQLLQSGGASADPNWTTATYPGTATGARKILVADGTNWTASTETYAVPGTSGNLMTSDGTNWTSASFAGGLSVANITLTSAQIKTLHASPITVIPAQGAGKVVLVVGQPIGKFVYGGSNVFVAGAGQVVSLYFGTAFQIGIPITNAILVGTTSGYVTNNPATITGTALSTFENTAITLYNVSATEISGNAANNNTISYSVLYRVVSI